MDFFRLRKGQRYIVRLREQHDVGRRFLMPAECLNFTRSHFDFLYEIPLLFYWKKIKIKITNPVPPYK
jgi:hypothetical protein